MRTMINKYLHRTQRGQSLVELALAFTVIMFLLAGAVDFGMALFTYVVLRDAAKEGATYGSMNPTDIAGITARVRAASPRADDQFAMYPVDVNNDSLVEVTVDWTDPSKQCEGLSNGESTGIIVTVEFNYYFSMPFIGPILGHDSIPLKAVATDTILTPSCQ